jgi:metallo-beta-lactamase class B
MPWGALEAGVRARWADFPLDAQKVKPFKLFDNVYYVGVEVVSAYLITTSAGQILIDATYAETADLLLNNVREAGFDPATIKYLIITHQHFDHFAGAGKVQQVTGARVAMSQADWDGVEQQQRAGGRGQNPGITLKRDMVINDGDTIKLGDTTVKLYVTPGHTPGSIAVEVPVRDRGKTYRALDPCFGINPSPELTAPFIKSMERLKQLGPWDALLPPHAFLQPHDDFTPPRTIIQGPPEVRRAVNANPAVIGSARINAWIDQILSVANEKLRAEQKTRSTGD